MKKDKKIILLVEDDQDDKIFFQEVLEDLDNPVILNSAEHRLDVIELLKNLNGNKPDAIFLDLNMPVLDGHKCLKLIRSNAEYKARKIIIYSTSYHPGIAKTLKDDGANHYIQKPSDYLTLKNTKKILKALG